MDDTLPDPVEFAKLSGAGNDFICIDNRDGRYSDLLSSGRVSRFTMALCQRGMAVGADGVIFVGRIDPDSPGVDGEARFFEPDGSEAELCGNGTGCLVYWVTEQGWLPDTREIRILTAAGVARGRRNGSDGQVKVCIPLPGSYEQDMELEVKGERWRCDYLVVGVPHVVTYVENLDHLDVWHWGPGFRHHPRFQPRGANANFVEVLGEGRLVLRTFEFGVERETLACGTGASAAAVAAARRFQWPKEYLNGEKPVLVRVRSGDTLRIFVTTDGDQVVDLCLETAVRFIYTGSLQAEMVRRALNPTQPGRDGVEMLLQG